MYKAIKKLKLKYIFYFIVFLFLNTTIAQVSLSEVFNDGMVLQQETNVAIWGKGMPDSKVKAFLSWSKEAYSTKVLPDSSWRMKIKTPLASYMHHQIDVFSDKDSISLNNVLIGEVWLCSGQSNMALPLKGALNQGVEGSLDAIVNSKNNYIRYFGVAQKSTISPQLDTQGVWQYTSPQTSGYFSAVAYFFAKKLQETLDVPVGIIVSAWGGSTIEAWMSKEALSDFDFVSLPKSEMENEVIMQTPTALFNGMLSGIVGYGIKGVLWYQGESNRSVFKQYPFLFEAMHKDWEQKWEIGVFPIFLAQIAPFAYENMDTAPHSALMREAQVKIANEQKNTGLIVLSDLGDSLSIHPPKKREVGERFAYLTLGKTYGMDFLDYKSSQYKSIEIKEEKILVTFEGITGVTFNDKERTGFEIAGSDKKFYPAEVQFDVHFDSALVLTSPKVPHPIAVRYGWKNYFNATLFGGNGLPVSSFRSDDW